MLTVFKTVKEVSDNIKQIAPNQQPTSERGTNHRRTHFSKIIVGGGALVGVISVVSAFIWKNYTYFPIGVVLFFTNGMAFYYLDELDLLAPLNDIALDMRERVLLMKDVTKELREHEESQKKIVAKVENATENHLKIVETDKQTFEQAILVLRTYQQVMKTEEAPKALAKPTQQDKEVVFRTINLLENLNKNFEELIEISNKISDTSKLKTIAKKINTETEKIENSTEKLKDLQNLPENIQKMEKLTKNLQKYHAECVNFTVDQIQKKHKVENTTRKAKKTESKK